MFKKFFTILLLTGYSLHGGLFNPSPSPQGSGIRNYAVLSNQAEITDGNNVLWSSPVNIATSRITVDNSGYITLQRPGTYLVQYAVKVTKSPSNGTATAVVQLQQTASGVSTNIAQPAMTTHTWIDGIDVNIPQSDSEIVGWSIVNVTSSSNNTINLAISLTGTNIEIPATTGLDANAQLLILNLN
jgi:hypothetical protein